MIRNQYPRFKWPVSGYKVLCDGNSLTAGANASSAAYYWPNLAAGLYPLSGGGVAPVNVAVSGQGIATTGSGGPASTMNSRAAAYVDTALSTTIPNILTVWELTNEVKYLSGAWATAYDNLRAYCLARKSAAASAGATLRIVVATTMPAYYSSQTQSTIIDWNNGINSANNKIRSNYREFADVLCDVAAHPAMAQIFTNGTYTTAEFDATGLFSDRVHLTDASYLSVAATAFAQAFKRVRL